MKKMKLSQGGGILAGTVGLKKISVRKLWGNLAESFDFTLSS